ncbi:MAG TPA: AzlD domain-containing protein [Solirubrobacteraceae bacterium]|nr:AzlD domain-containing protein [Solirubrobacteraceae bacterium]
MSTAWTLIGALAVINFTIKAAGPVIAGRRELPDLAQRFITASVPALVAGLIVTGTFASDGKLVLDERAAGIGAAALALVLRAPLLVVLVAAAGTTALLRAARASCTAHGLSERLRALV